MHHVKHEFARTDVVVEQLVANMQTMWNCRGLRRKKGLLQQFIHKQTNKPDIILVQEANSPITLPGYDHFMQGSITKKDRQTPQGTHIPVTTITYVARHIPAIQIDTASINNSTQEQVIVQCRLNNRDVIIANVYWSPGLDWPSVRWIDAYTQQHKHMDIILAGDFNAHNTSWGYTRTTKTGMRLERKTQDNRYTLLNDTTDPTRQGNSVERDTNPDLSWHRGVGNVTWTNLHENLGSDHHIIEIKLADPRIKPRPTHSGPKTHLTDWHRFRLDLDQVHGPTDLQSWVNAICETKSKHTKNITRSPEHPQIDSHLLNVWNKRHRLVQKWKKQKGNRGLRKAIRQITLEAEEYAQQLCTENWLETCDQLNGQLHTPKVWKILRTLLGQGYTRHTMDKIMMHSGKTREQTAEEIYRTFYPIGPSTDQLPSYPPESLDQMDTGINSNFTGELSTPRALNTGVPQGSILSPTLFNIALLHLPAQLSSISHLQHNIYADDITIWCCKGSLGQQEHTIQSGLNVIQNHLSSIGLKCSPTKSEFIVVTNQTGRKAEEQRDSIKLHIDHTPIPRRSHIRILGFLLQDNGKAHVWMDTILRQLNQIYHMLSRVTRRQRGLKEQELRRIIEALVYSRVLYQLPYLSITKTQLSKLEAALRRYTRLALGVPRFAANFLVASTGLFNTLEERTTICRQAHIARLQTSPQGRKLLEHQGYDTTTLPPFPPPPPPPWESLPRVTVMPIPRHMHPDKHAARRTQLVQRIDRETPRADTTYYYTDASHSPSRSITAVVGPGYEHINEHSNVPTASAAETLAVLEAITRPHHPTHHICIRTDSQETCRSFRDGALPGHIHSLLQRHLDTHPSLHVTLQWIPGHQGVEEHNRAHELTRVTNFPGPPCLWPSDYDPKEHRKLLHKERTSLLRELRANTATIIAPPQSLSREDSAILRRLQTNSVVTPLFRHYIQGLAGRPKCPNCGEYPSLEHCLWQCSYIQPTLLSSLSSLSHSLQPHSWTDWLSPPTDAHILLPALIQHVKNVLGEDW
ncbi:uncharacterized protein LOC115329459 [Ixodes scapularis]|uniref:uncharacterized protein LOC115329459 n=1 Tax=Ixodes scapularis TaxID=6945 RepID=UPI001A9F8957|nr:uncharacterized protein LOC115329459 [Ixodes scapularis]